MGQAASVTTTMSDKMVAMTFVEDLGRVGGKTVGGHLLVGYDDVKSVQYFKQNLVLLEEEISDNRIGFCRC